MLLASLVLIFFANRCAFRTRALRPNTPLSIDDVNRKAEKNREVPAKVCFDLIGGKTKKLESAAGTLPINFPQDNRLLAILDGNRFARMQLVAAASSLGSCVTNQDLATLRI